MRSNTVGFSFALWFFSNLFGAIFSWIIICLQNESNMVVDARDFYNLLQSFGFWMALAGLTGLYRSLPALLIHLSLNLVIVKLPINKRFGLTLTTVIAMLLCVLTFFIYFYHKKPEEFWQAEEMRQVIPGYLMGILLSAFLIRNTFFEPRRELTMQSETAESVI